MKTQNIICLARRNHSFGIFNIRKLSVSVSKQKLSNRWHLSAEGFLLLPSALRPHLLGQKCKKYGFRDIFCDKIASNYAKFTKNAHFLAILAIFKIVAASTIFGYLFSTPVSAASLTLTIPSSFSLDITPGANGVFSKSPKQTVNVKTDNSSGYTLSIKAKNNENSNSLINSNNSINNRLNSISEQTSEDNFKSDSKFNNSWGYLPSKFNNLDNTNFLPGPTIEESVLETTEDANNESGTDYNITLGAKIDNTMSSGSYNNNFIFSAIANEPKVTPMQDWDGCGELSVNETIQLRDNRDNEIYQVAKLKDGKCWMVDNLRLGKDTEMTLTPEDTNTTENITLPANDDTSSYNDAIHKDSSHGTYYTLNTISGVGGAQDLNVISSICPKGWHVPTGSNLRASELSNLMQAYNNSPEELLNNPLPGFSLSGYYSFSRQSIIEEDEQGYVVSSTLWESSEFGSDQYFMYITNTGISIKYETIAFLHDTGYNLKCVSGNIGSPITFRVGNDIEFIKVADTGNYANTPKYVFSGKEITYDNVPEDTDFIISAVVKPGYKLKSWTKEGNGTIANNTLLTTVYTSSDGPQTVTVDGEVGTYPSMQDFSNCSENGENVTDVRNGQSYTVAKLGEYCYMLDNLRLEAGTELNSTTSDISSDNTFTLPSKEASDAWVSSDQNYYAKANMKEYREDNHPETVAEYYYNWYAAKANPNEPTNPKSMSVSSSDDKKSLGSICPKNWTLPSYDNDVIVEITDSSGLTSAKLMANGIISSGKLQNSGASMGGSNFGVWLSKDTYSGTLYSPGSYAFGLVQIIPRDQAKSTLRLKGSVNKSYGASVRCARSATSGSGPGDITTQ